MNNLVKSITTGATALAFAATLVFGLGSTAQAASCYQYDAKGFPTSQTPVFNNVCGVPGYGDERDFVRLRADVNGDTNTGGNAYSDPVSSTCADGAKYDVHTYVHNDAEPQYNADGSGSAVAHNVRLAMSAPLGKTANDFTFASTLSASNASTVSDTGTLNCNGQNVKLSLVPSTVKVYSQSYGWKDLGDSAVNGTTKLGSPYFGSGNQYGCWNYRISVVYEVVVHKVSTPKPSTGICKTTGLDVNKNRNVTVSVTGETSNAKIIGYKIDFGDNTVTNQQTASHTYAKTGTYKITGYVEVQYANGKTEWKTANSCMEQVTFKVNTPPHVTPPTPTPTPPTTLPSTGPVGLAGLFAGTSSLGAVGHMLYRRRKFNR